MCTVDEILLNSRKVLISCPTNSPCICGPRLMLQGLSNLVVGGEDDGEGDEEAEGVDVRHVGQLVEQAGIALSLPNNPTTDQWQSLKVDRFRWFWNLTFRLLWPKTPQPRRGGIASRKELESWMDQELVNRFWRFGSWCFGKILRLNLGRDFEVRVWLRFWSFRLVAILKVNFNVLLWWQNSTLASLVPLAMFHERCYVPTNTNADFKSCPMTFTNLTLVRLFSFHKSM